MAQSNRDQLGLLIGQLVEPFVFSGTVDQKDLVYVHAGHLIIDALTACDYDEAATRAFVTEQIEAAFEKAIDSVVKGAAEFEGEVPRGAAELAAKVKARREASANV